VPRATHDMFTVHYLQPACDPRHVHRTLPPASSASSRRASCPSPTWKLPLQLPLRADVHGQAGCAQRLGLIVAAASPTLAPASTLACFLFARSAWPCMYQNVQVSCQTRNALRLSTSLTSQHASVFVSARVRMQSHNRLPQALPSNNGALSPLDTRSRQLSIISQ